MSGTRSTGHKTPNILTPHNPTAFSSIPTTPPPISIAIIPDDPNPFRLGTRDHPNFFIVPSPLTRQDNFQSWKRVASISISAENKTAFIDGSLPRPPANDANHSSKEQCNNMVMDWLLPSVSKEIKASIMYNVRVVDMWNDLHGRFNLSNKPWIFQLKTSIQSLKQGDNNVNTLPNSLLSRISFKNISLALLAFVVVLGEPSKLHDYYTIDQIIQFLTGLSDSYRQIWAQILLYDPFPSLRKVFSYVVQEERQRSLGLNLAPINAAAPVS
ncbi:uncharacterized protein LOC133815537 [Humulus lupulus]|uniref:uncharacterized protein LOC133815537 n=1 Tax=Humulus lupulus TaxID=3486 RepID=UPI002B409289|nr:uncharacterized protein LOC133815537 [Humulus lupulus]